MIPPSTEPGDTGHADDTETDTGTRSDAGTGTDEIDLVAIESDLDGVQAALTRLADGTYWTDEVTGATIPDEILVAAPLARRA